MMPANIPPHPQVPPQTVYVSFSAEIIPATTESLIATMSNLVNQRVPNVHLLLSTPGGSVMHGMNLYNVLRAMPFNLTSHNVGNVDSIGNAVFLAGTTRYACPHSTFMFHGVGFDVPACRLEEKTLRERLDGLLNESALPSRNLRSPNCSGRPLPKTLHTPLAMGLLMRSETSRFLRAVP
jgi:Clp protease